MEGEYRIRILFLEKRLALDDASPVRPFHMRLFVSVAAYQPVLCASTKRAFLHRLVVPAHKEIEMPSDVYALRLQDPADRFPHSYSAMSHSRAAPPALRMSLPYPPIVAAMPRLPSANHYLLRLDAYHARLVATQCAKCLRLSFF